VTILQELAKKGPPDWVDRSAADGLIRDPAGRFGDASKHELSTIERVAPAARCGPRPSFTVASPGSVDRGGEAEALLRPLAVNGAETIGPSRALELATNSTRA